MRGDIKDWQQNESKAQRIKIYASFSAVRVARTRVYHNAMSLHAFPRQKYQRFVSEFRKTRLSNSMLRKAEIARRDL